MMGPGPLPSCSARTSTLRCPGSRAMHVATRSSSHRHTAAIGCQNNPTGQPNNQRPRIVLRNSHQAPSPAENCFGVTSECLNAQFQRRQEHGTARTTASARRVCAWGTRVQQPHGHPQQQQQQAHTRPGAGGAAGAPPAQCLGPGTPGSGAAPHVQRHAAGRQG